jgi:hypothetical protein
MEHKDMTGLPGNREERDLLDILEILDPVAELVLVGKLDPKAWLDSKDTQEV